MAIKRNSFREVPCVIAVDQSYTRTGIALAINGKLKVITGTDFKHKGKYTKSKPAKRLEIEGIVRKLIDKCLQRYRPEDIVIIVERVRLFSHSGPMGNNIALPVIKGHAAIIGRLVDLAYNYGIRVYSVDTRCWKSRVLGSSKPIFEPIEGVTDPNKFGSVRKVIDLGFEDSIKVYAYRLGRWVYDDDKADAACMALYGSSGEPYKLLLEE